MGWPAHPSLVGGGGVSWFAPVKGWGPRAEKLIPYEQSSPQEMDLAFCLGHGLHLEKSYRL